MTKLAKKDRSQLSLFGFDAVSLLTVKLTAGYQLLLAKSVSLFLSVAKM